MTLDEKIIQLYREGKSTYQIAEMIGNNWYANKVRRRLKALGVKLKTKKEAQAVALQTGRSTHPTRGKHHSAETRSIIGESVSNAWANLTEVERMQRSVISKKNWDSMPEADKERLRELSAKAIRKAADEGSKAEKFLLKKLGQNGWRVEFHSTKRLPVENLQIDLFLPEILTAIEVDGLSHVSDEVWGKEAFAKTLAADQKKNALLMQNGYNVIRLQITINKVSNTYLNKVWKKLSVVLDGLKGNYRRPVEERLILLTGE